MLPFLLGHFSNFKPTSLICLLTDLVHSVHIITSAKVEVKKKKKTRTKQLLISLANPFFLMRVNTDFHSKVEVAKYFHIEKKLHIVAICMLCMGHVGQVCVSSNTQFPYLSRATLKISLIAPALNAPTIRLFTY